jgi:hypothetical protein
MATPSVLRIERPYASLDAYLEGDAWTVERTEMVLVGAPVTEIGAAVTFEIALRDGSVVVSGDARVVAEVHAEGERPSGLRVRFRKLDAASKGVLRRALEARRRANPEGTQETPSAVTNDIPDSRVVNEIPEPLAAPAPPAGRVTREPSGVRHRALGVIQAPENREELLARLRGRTGSR